MPPSENWFQAPASPNLADHDVHVWRAFLDSEETSPQFATTLLTEDERDRAARFVFPRDRHRFIAARNILRTIVAGYLKRPAAEVELSYEGQGKPRLRLQDSDPSICFNVSHSQGVAVYAFAGRRELGVDVEAVRVGFDCEDLAQQVFSPGELSELHALPLPQRDDGFFRGWTRKEAYVKALGCGLTMPLNTFSLSLTSGMPETFLGADSRRWTLRSFQPFTGYAGAIVAEGDDWDLQFWDWSIPT